MNPPISRQRGQEMRPIRIGPIIKDAFNVLRASLPATIEMRLDIEDEARIVEADPTQWEPMAASWR